METWRGILFMYRSCIQKSGRDINHFYDLSYHETMFPSNNLFLMDMTFLTITTINQYNYSFKKHVYLNAKLVISLFKMFFI